MPSDISDEQNQHRSKFTLDELVSSAAELLNTMVDRSVQTGTFSPSEDVSYAESVRRWEALEESLDEVCAGYRSGEEPQELVDCFDSGQIAKIMEAYRTNRDCDPDPERDVRIQEVFEYHEAAISGKGNPSRLSSNQLVRLNKAFQAAYPTHTGLSGKAYGDVTAWILRNETTTAKPKAPTQEPTLAPGGGSPAA
ncbi:hypothetical protein FFLO_06303 [Filobasidium floriforme]|uniref:Uncharacterized protein n=2 Tax=Filobasidium floriforme TaxID=5210 RepID=A0A8K0JF66_9TREE|nr:hypothetical protein FFLO_06303 [Filobasidium floriforme]